MLAEVKMARSINKFNLYFCNGLLT